MQSGLSNAIKSHSLIESTFGGLVISMKDYADSVTELVNIRDADKYEPLTLLENKIYRKYIGKIGWLAENCRPDLTVTALKLVRSNSKATSKDLKVINSVVRRIREKKNEVRFSKIGNKEDLVVTGISDASYRMDENAIGGNIILMRNKRNVNVLLIFWKSKTIPQVYHSAKEAETKNIRLIDESLYRANVIEQVLFNRKKVNAEFYTGRYQVSN